MQQASLVVGFLVFFFFFGHALFEKDSVSAASAKVALV